MAIWLLTILLLRAASSLRAQPYPANFRRIPLPKMHYAGRDSLDAPSRVAPANLANPTGILRIVEDDTPQVAQPISSKPSSFRVPQLQGKYDLPSLPASFKGHGLSGGELQNPVRNPTVAGTPGPAAAPAGSKAAPATESSYNMVDPLPKGSLSAGDMSWKGQPLGSQDTGGLSASMPETVGMPITSDVPGDTSAPKYVPEFGIAPEAGTVSANDGGVAQAMNDPKYLIAAGCEGRTFGVYADPADVRCWFTCLGLGQLGARFCCAWNACWKPPQTFFPLGSCQACSPPPPPSPPPPR
jgi:hypothetical protein